MTTNAGTLLQLLFVEDREDDAELAVRQLAREGFDVDWRRVDNEPDLRDILRRWHPDVVLSDYSMPAFNGRAALRVCREVVPDIPFIFLSGTIGEELAIESIYEGATDYVLKDNLRRLSTSITRALKDTMLRRHAQESERARSRLVAILEATSDFVAIAHPDDSVLYLNRGARQLLGLGTEDRSLTLEQLFPAGRWRDMRDQLLALASDTPVWHSDAEMVDVRGENIPVSQVVIPHYDEAGELEFFSFIARDIRDRKEYERQIRYLANYDPLTDLPNRTLLADRATQAISFHRDKGWSLALLIVDVDRFKLINDGYGRDCGDALLRAVGKRLDEVTRPGDTVARISADCFAMLATRVAGPEDMASLISRMHHRLRAPFLIEGSELRITVGMGISVFPRDGQDFDSLLQNADAAMHRVKETGQAGFQFYTSEMTRRASEQVRLETELRQALAKNELELHYQAQVNIEKASLIGFEALMRWQHPERGMVSPGVFIPIAESSDLINQMGEWALLTACRQIKRWDAAGFGHCRIAVNVSARQFRTPGFVDLVASAVRASNLEPWRLELELTESILVHDVEEAFMVLTELNRLGVQIALDDFGTGYSNLSYLSRLPIDRLKIDKSFVQRALHDSNDAEIVRAVISLADTLGLRVIAEGIEQREQLELLRSYRCEEGQGFYFAKPLPASQIPGLLHGARTITLHGTKTEEPTNE